MILTSLPVISGLVFYMAIAWSVFGDVNAWLAWLLPLLVGTVFLATLGLFLTVSNIRRVQTNVLALFVLMIPLFLLCGIPSVGAVIAIALMTLIAGLGYAFVFSRAREETRYRVSYEPVKILSPTLRLMIGINVLLVSVLVFSALQQDISFQTRSVEIPKSWFRGPVQLATPVVRAFVSDYSVDMSIEDIFADQIQTQQVSPEQKRDRQQNTEEANRELEAQKEKLINQRLNRLRATLGVPINRSDTVPEILQRVANDRIQSMFGGSRDVAAGIASVLLFLVLWSLSIVFLPLLIFAVRLNQAVLFRTGVLESHQKTVQKTVVEPSE
ncbi:MAG: hypothetical protein BRC23_00835 [Parcubacteria group bacterium SW_4_49_11]|nr:MAG: hypothetical protein BRC23_00835 [Parcubacteria group bacterium SW_4_49_11]